MTLANTAGLVAGFCTTVSFLPQVVRTIKTKSVRDLSVGTVFLFLVGILLWLLYGIMTNQWPIIVANSITLVLVAVEFVFMMMYRKKFSPQ